MAARARFLDVMHPLLYRAIALALGIQWGIQSSVGWSSIFIVVAGFTVVLLSRRKWWAVVLRAGIFWAIAGVFLGASHSSPGPLPPGLISHSTVWVEGRIHGPLRISQDRVRVQLTGVTVRSAERRIQIGGDLQLSIPAGVDTSRWTRGTTIGAYARLQPTRLGGNPGQPGWGATQLRRGIQATGWVAEVGDVTHRPERSGEAPAWVDRARRRFRLWTDENLSKSSAALLQAVVLGDSGAVEPHSRAAWRDAGLAHLLAISGLHVGVIAWVVFRLVGWGLALFSFWSRRWPVTPAAAVVAVAVAWMYVWVAGAPISAVRAGWMLTGLFGAHWLGRSSDSVSALSMAFIAVVTVDPTAPMDPSFQLSFVAVASLMAGMATVDRFVEWLSERIPFTFLRWLTGSIVRTMSASLICTVSTLPIVWWYFGEASVHGIWANTVAIPLVSIGVVVPGLFVFFLLCMGLDGVASCLAAWLEVGSLSAHRCAHWVSHSVGASTTSWLVAVALTGLVLALGVRWLRRRPLHVLAVCGIVLCVVSWLSGANRFHDSVRITFLSVGHGDAIVVQTPHNRTILVDAGGDPLGHRRIGRDIVLPALHGLGIDRIDLAVITHPHPDHFQGFDDLLGRIPIHRLWISKWPERPGPYADLVGRFQSAQVPVFGPGDWPTSSTLDGVVLNILHPSSGVSESLSLNDNSLVIEFKYNRFTALMTGDIEAAGERSLLRLGRDLSTTVLKVPHHGSATSSGTPLIRATNPEWAIVQCREGGLFNFPHPDVQARYEALGIPVSVTGLDGAIQVETDGINWSVGRFR